MEVNEAALAHYSVQYTGKNSDIIDTFSLWLLHDNKNKDEDKVSVRTCDI